MLEFLLAQYRLIDEHLLSRLPHRAQRIVKKSLLSTARFFLGARLPATMDERRMLWRLPPRLARPSLPAWAHNDMDELARVVDASLAPGPFMASRPPMRIIPPDRAQAGHAYFALARLAGQRADAVLLAPAAAIDSGHAQAYAAAWSACGINGLYLACPAETVVVRPEPQPGLATDAWIVLEDALAAYRLLPEEMVSVVARLLVQWAPATIHVCASDFGWALLERHGLALSQNSKLFVSLPASVPPSPAAGIAHHIAQADPAISAYFVDDPEAGRSVNAKLGVSEHKIQAIGPRSSPFDANARQALAARLRGVASYFPPSVASKA
jgi:hypothetical protein